MYKGTITIDHYLEGDTMKKEPKIETEENEEVVSDNYDDHDFGIGESHISDHRYEEATDQLLDRFSQQMENYLNCRVEEKMANILMKISSLVYNDYREQRDQYKRLYESKKD